MKNFFLNILNRHGFYTKSQYLQQIEQKEEIKKYASELECAVNGMSDPKKPIVVFGSNVRLADIQLDFMQQIIVSPNAKYVSLSGIYCRGKQ